MPAHCRIFKHSYKLPDIRPDGQSVHISEHFVISTSGSTRKKQSKATKGCIVLHPSSPFCAAGVTAAFAFGDLGATIANAGVFGGIGAGFGGAGDAMVAGDVAGGGCCECGDCGDCGECGDCGDCDIGSALDGADCVIS